jgi:hypothetical protein
MHHPNPELFHAGELRALWRLLNHGAPALERELVEALNNPHAPDAWIEGLLHIDALAREVRPNADDQAGCSQAGS